MLNTFSKYLAIFCHSLGVFLLFLCHRSWLPETLLQTHNILNMLLHKEIIHSKVQLPICISIIKLNMVNMNEEHMDKKCNDINNESTACLGVCLCA